MTRTEAHKFVTRWKRILIPWAARTESGEVRDMERSMIGGMGGMFLMAIIALPRMDDSLFWRVVETFACLLLGISFWLVVKLQAARRALGKS